MNDLNAVPPILEVNGLSKRYVMNAGFWQQLTRRPPELLHAVDDVSLRIAPGEIFGLVGESGSGKSVCALSLVRLLDGAQVQGQVRWSPPPRC